MLRNPFSDITFELRCRRSPADLRAHLEAQLGLIGSELEVIERAPGAQQYVLAFTLSGFIAQERRLATAARQGFSPLLRAHLEERADGTVVAITIVALRFQLAALGMLVLWIATSLALQQPSSRLRVGLALALVAGSALSAAYLWDKTLRDTNLAMSILLEANDQPNEPPPTF